jgi:glycosyltransferase involved in cell wall biosynthesis
MAHNVESLIWQRYFEMESNPAKRWYIERQWHKMERFEAGVFNRVAKVVTVSHQDAALVRDRFQRPDVDVVDNGVDTEFFRPSSVTRDRGNILFLGSLDWRPNLDGVQLLLDELFPAILAKESCARLTIVGRNPPAWLREKVQRSRSVELHADVADVRPFLHRCTVLAVPLRIGGGSRLKILEALSTGTPVVSTRVGAEGLRLVAGKHFIETDVGRPMVDALLAVIRDSTSAAAMAQAGQAVVGQEYDWSMLAQRLDDVWQSALAPSAAT